MRNIVLFMLIAIGAAMLITQWPANGQSKKPALSSVTVAVKGLHCQGSLDDLLKALGKVDGVEEVKGVLAQAQVTAKLDESKVTASKFLDIVAAQPQMVNPKKHLSGQLVLYVHAEKCADEKQMCTDCVTEITRALKQDKGISAVTAGEGKTVYVSFAKGAKVSTAAIAKALGATKSKYAVSFNGAAGATAPAAADHSCCK